MQTKKPLQTKELEGPVYYEAQCIQNFIQEKKTVLLGKAKISYQDMILQAGKITVDWDTRTLLAEGLPETLWVKNANGDSVFTVQMAGLPEFAQGEDVMRGEVMTYNFNTRRGRVLRGRTAYEDGFYRGEILKMTNPKTLHVAEGKFTTCPLDTHPHFLFWSKQMKILINDMVIARPIVFFVGRIPVLALPFAVFPVKKGRHSGFLIPRYGESTLQGRYLRGIGYYWAPNDYFDIKPTLDFFETGGFLFRTDVRYQVRYRLSGAISGSVTQSNFKVGGVQGKRWDLNFSHRQEISPSAQLSASGSLVSSGNFYRELSSSREHRLQRDLRSNVTLVKRFGSTWSVTVNFNQTRRLDTDEVTESFPQIAIRSGQLPWFRKPAPKGKTQPEMRWYHQIYSSYSSQLLFRRQTRPVGDQYVEQQSKGWDHSFRFSSTQKLFGWLNVTPSLNYQQTWFDRRKIRVLDPKTNTFDTRFESGLFIRHLYDASVGMGTKVYGVFYPPGIKSLAFRHVMTPTLSYTVQPDFSSKRYGYYEIVEDTTGKVYTFDRYEGILFSSTPRMGRKGLHIGLQNLFQMKMGEGEKAKRIDLFNYNLSTAYNWKAKQFKLSDFSSSFHATPFSNLSLDLRATHSPYRVNAKGAPVDTLLIHQVDWTNWKSITKTQWLRLTHFTTEVSFQFRGKTGSGKSQPEETSLPAQKSDLEDLQNVRGDRFELEDARRMDLSIPWSLSGTLSYSENRSNPFSIQKTFWCRTTLDFQLTRNWKVGYHAQYDFMLKKVVSQDIELYRDLHCWEATILWTPTGYNKRLYFRINIKSPMLKDLKFEKGTGRMGLYGY